MSEEANEYATVTALLLAGVESDVAKVYAARVVGSSKAEPSTRYMAEAL